MKLFPIIFTLLLLSTSVNSQTICTERASSYGLVSERNNSDSFLDITVCYNGKISLLNIKSFRYSKVYFYVGEKTFLKRDGNLIYYKTNFFPDKENSVVFDGYVVYDLSKPNLGALVMLSPDNDDAIVFTWMVNLD